jgi:hypothetical protein
MHVLKGFILGHVNDLLVKITATLRGAVANVPCAKVGNGNKARLWLDCRDETQ